MITNNGIELMSKYLAGQAGSYASYIAIGCGARPLSEGEPVLAQSNGTVSSVVGPDSNGMYTGTITFEEQINYMEPGDLLSAQGTPPPTGGSPFSSATVVAQTSPTSITVSSDVLSAGKITAINVYSSIRSKNLADKTKLDFEVARFPITSRSYVVDKRSERCTQLSQIGTNQINVTTYSKHTFVSGDTVTISKVSIPESSEEVTYEEVNGIYKITSVSDTSFRAVAADDSVLGPWTGLNNYSGFYYNFYEFLATVYTKQISLTAEMPESSAYDITELGVFSLGSDQFATTQNSRNLLNFTENESWKYFDPALSEDFELNYDDPISLPFGSTPFFVSSNAAFWNADIFRKIRQEKPRILSDALVVPGDLSDWGFTGWDINSKYLTIDNPGIDLSNVTTNDKLVFAFSIANAVAEPSHIPTQYHLQFKFLSGDGENYATASFDLISGDAIPGNRYIVYELDVVNINKTSLFDWKNVSSLNIYASIQQSGEVPTNQYAFVFDGLRLESSVNNNPLYALTAYTIVNNASLEKIIKNANSKDLINFRIDLGIGQ
jgi:hypothetical protein